MKTNVFDCHTHTIRSHDCTCTPMALFKQAAKKGLCGVAVTNHCDLHLCQSVDVLSPLAASDADVRGLRSAFDGQLQLLSGVEIGEGILFPEQTRTVCNLADWDIILGSVHTVRFENDLTPYSAIDFSPWTAERIHAFLDAYFCDVLETANMDIDVLCHLTCPLRYIVGRFGHSVDLQKYHSAIQKILRRIIERNIALEVNTSCIGGNYNTLLPDKAVLSQYYALGGRTITLGSDAHTAENVGKDFDRAIQTLRSIGFQECSFFVQRKRKAYPI